MPETLLLSDDKSISEVTDDRLGRANLVNLIVESIKARQNDKKYKSLSIGIHGEWGEGKTSLMRMVKGVLDTSEINTFWYNPWTSPDCNQMLSDFFTEFSRLSFDKKTSSAISSYVRELLRDDITLSPETSAYVERLKLSVPSENGEISALKKTISKGIVDNHKDIVVFIDDIDRLLPIEIQTVFKITRHLADFDNVIYVMAFDPNVVSKVLGKVYNSDELGRNYMDKMIQVPLVLPIIQQVKIKNEIKEQLERVLMSKDMHNFISLDDLDRISTKLSQVLKTKRAVIRYINQLSFVFPLVCYDTEFEDLCLTELLKYIEVQGWLEIFHKRNELLKISTGRVNEDLETNKSNAINSVVKKFNGMSSFVEKILTEDLFPNDSNSIALNKLCDPLSFSQYFICVSPDNVIPGKEAYDLMELALKGEIDKIKEWIKDKKENAKISFEDAEILKAISSCLNYSKKPHILSDVEKIAATLCEALGTSVLTERFPYLSKANPNTADDFIARYIIPNYLGHEFKSGTQDLIVNNTLVRNVLRHIFKNASINFCISLVRSLCDHNGKVYFIKNVFRLIINRIEPREAIFDYSFDSQVTFFQVWQRTDSKEYNSFMAKYFNNPETNAGILIKDWWNPYYYPSSLYDVKQNVIAGLIYPVKKEFENNLLQHNMMKDATVKEFNDFMISFWTLKGPFNKKP